MQISCERFRALSGPAKSRSYLKDNRPVYKVASEASYWFSRLKTMDIVTVYNVRIEFGNEGCGRETHTATVCRSYRRDGPLKNRLHSEPMMPLLGQ